VPEGDVSNEESGDIALLFIGEVTRFSAFDGRRAELLEESRKRVEAIKKLQIGNGSNRKGWGVNLGGREVWVRALRMEQVKALRLLIQADRGSKKKGQSSCRMC